MKIEGTKPASPGRTRTAGRTGTAASAGAGRQIADNTAIMGVPEAELTPRVRAALMALMEEVAQLRDELRQSKGRIEYLEHLADQDSMLPIYNRRAFVRELTRAISITERYGTPSSVIYFDVNGMKSINDGYSHAAGDAALSKIVEKLTEQVRDSDAVGRLGGDEFGVILFQADENSAQLKATQLAESIRQEPLQYNDDEIELNVTYGFYTFTGKEDAAEALAAADEAMYASKRSAHK